MIGRLKIFREDDIMTQSGLLVRIIILFSICTGSFAQAEKRSVIYYSHDFAKAEFGYYQYNLEGGFSFVKSSDIARYYRICPKNFDFVCYVEDWEFEFPYFQIFALPKLLLTESKELDWDFYGYHFKAIPLIMSGYKTSELFYLVTVYPRKALWEQLPEREKWPVKFSSRFERFLFSSERGILSFSQCYKDQEEAVSCGGETYLLGSQGLLSKDFHVDEPRSVLSVENAEKLKSASYLSDPPINRD